MIWNTILPSLILNNINIAKTCRLKGRGHATQHPTLEHPHALRCWLGPTMRFRLTRKYYWRGSICIPNDRKRSIVRNGHPLAGGHVIHETLAFTVLYIERRAAQSAGYQTNSNCAFHGLQTSIFASRHTSGYASPLMGLGSGPVSGYLRPRPTSQTPSWL